MGRILAATVTPSRGDGSTLTRNQALHIPMRDGVRIAIDVWLPGGIEEGALLPTMIRATRYWRARGFVDPPLYRKYGPHRSELRADGMPLVPGEVAEISFDLWATSVLIGAGHRIRVAVAGADAETFLRYPRDGSVPVLSVQRNATYPSAIVLPMKEVPE